MVSSPFISTRPRQPLFPYTTLFRSPFGPTSPQSAHSLPSDCRGGYCALRCPPQQRLRGDSVRPAPTHPHIRPRGPADRKSTRLNSSHVASSYAVLCLTKKNPTGTLV